MSTALNSEIVEDNDSSEHENKSDNENENEEETDGFVTDIQISVQCMMDLIPSMEQVLQQQSSTKASLMFEEGGRAKRLGTPSILNWVGLSQPIFIEG
jgi:hypothetical protein